jgi:hypothetical protein
LGKNATQNQQNSTKQAEKAPKPETGFNEFLNRSKKTYFRPENIIEDTKSLMKIRFFGVRRPDAAPSVLSCIGEICGLFTHR